MRSWLLVPDKVAQQAEELTTRGDDLSSVHRRREPVLPRCSLTSEWALIPTPTHNKEMNKMQ